MRWSDMGKTVVAEKWLERRELLSGLDFPPDVEYEMELEDLLGKPLELTHYPQAYFSQRLYMEMREFHELPLPARFEVFKFYADLSDRSADVSERGQCFLNGVLSNLMDLMKQLPQDRIVEAAEILYHKFDRAMFKDSFYKHLDEYLDSLVDTPIATEIKELQNRLFQSTLDSTFDGLSR